MKAKCSVQGCRGTVVEWLPFRLHPYGEWLFCRLGFCRKHGRMAGRRDDRTR